MQPYRITMIDEKGTYHYVVTGWDRSDAEHKARKAHAANPERPPGPMASRGRTATLSPVRVAGRYIPRVDGKHVPGETYQTRSEAVAASITWLEQLETAHR